MAVGVFVISMMRMTGRHDICLCIQCTLSTRACCFVFNNMKCIHWNIIVLNRREYNSIKLFFPYCSHYVILCNWPSLDLYIL